MGDLADLLTGACAQHAGSLAVEGEGAALSYDAIAMSAWELEQALRARGLSGNEPILVLVSNEPRDFFALLGVWRAGGVVVPVHRSTPEMARAAIRAATGARFLVGADDGLLRVLGDAVPARRPILDGAAIIVFTSGSTGRPKGVVLSHRAFVDKLTAIDSRLHFSAKTRSLLVLRITFVFGLWVSLLTLLKGGVILAHSRFEPRAILTAMGAERVTDAAFVPTMLRGFLRVEPEGAETLAARSGIQRILTGGEPLGDALSRRIRDLFPGAGIADIYGSTETCSSDFFLLPKEQERFPGTIGHAGPQIEYRIAESDGRELPIDTIGELQIRSPFVMNGYLDDPELTRAAFCGGFFRTGDLARQRPDGAVELTGRTKDVIVRGGSKISPLELDQLLSGHPSIAEALTVGVPDPMMGERIHVLVVARKACAIGEAELRKWVVERVEGFKRPDVYHFGAALPVGRTGKADRAALRAQIVAASGAEIDNGPVIGSID